MADVRDVARYILSKQSPMSAMKLQKLVYYAQAWHLVWDDHSLFDDPIEAWANGPVCPRLYDLHRGKFQIRKGDLGALPRGALDESEISTIDSVLKFYGTQSAAYLSELTHREAPWKLARRGFSPGARSRVEILPAAMVEYYGSLV